MENIIANLKDISLIEFASSGWLKVETVIRDQYDAHISIFSINYGKEFLTNRFDIAEEDSDFFVTIESRNYRVFAIQADSMDDAFDTIGMIRAVIFGVLGNIDKPEEGA
ncbi:MAG: hypothetical protein WCK32_00925 [Chlorobiaceae bacterium]